MSTKKKSLKLLFLLALVAGLMSVCFITSAAAEKTVIPRVVATGSWEPELDGRVTTNIDFTVTEGVGCIIEGGSGACWYKRSAYGSSFNGYSSTYFTSGVYMLRLKIRIDDDYADKYTLSLTQTEVYINGEEWEIVSFSTYYGDGYIDSPAVSACSHSGGTATCEEKAVCDKCGRGYGSALGHIGGEATCSEQAVCERCYEAYGETLPHTGGIASCSKLAVCTVCGEGYGDFDDNRHVSHKTLPAVAATCGKAGKTEGKICADCDEVILAQKVVAATGKHKGGTATCTKKAVCSVCKQSYGNVKAHTLKNTTTKATLKANGKIDSKCTVCGKLVKTTVIYMPKTIKLSATSYTYNGKVKNPSVTVTDSKGVKLKKDTDYTVKYSKGRKAIGKYTVTVTFKGKYSGTKKLTFNIVLGKTTLSKVAAGAKQITPTWKTVNGASGYEIQYSTSSKFTKKTTKKVTVKNGKTKKTTIKKLSEGKTYYVRVRAYKTVNKKNVYGAYSTVKSVKIKRVLNEREKRAAKALNECRRYCAYMYYDAKLLQNAITRYRITGSVSDYIDVLDYLSSCADNMNRVYNISKNYDELFMLKIHVDEDYPYVSMSSLASASSYATAALRAVSMYNIMADNYNLERIDTSD